MTGPSVVWFRDDLRTHDNPALNAAAARGNPIVCVYVLDEESRGIRPLGAASRWWLHHSLRALEQSLSEMGLTLTIRTGAAFATVTAIAHEVSAGAVHWNRRYGGPERRVDTLIKRALREMGVAAESHHGSVLVEPWALQTGAGEPYRVFSPYAKASLGLPAPRRALRRPRGVQRGLHPDGTELDRLDLLPRRPDWAAGLRKRWKPGEEQAAKRLRSFAASGLAEYRDGRDEPGAPATSYLSAHLRFGEISPFQVWHATMASAEYRRELLWRDFAYHVLYHWPDLARRNLRPVFDSFERKSRPSRPLRAWQRGVTGIPFVDAGMRELWHTGYMHNRVRMVAASFLVKNLLVDWRRGEEWFWDTLVDADPASNPFNWQWVAGSGVDAAPYFRIFNPELQAAKFDPDGDYQRRWLPELGTERYPPPLVDLSESRARALATYKAATHRGDQGIRPPSPGTAAEADG